MPYRLAGFGDEISTDIQIQMDHLLENGVLYCAMRGANARPVLELEQFQIDLITTQFRNRGIKFSCLASSVGQMWITDPFPTDLERFKIACIRAKELGTKVIRIFSYFIPQEEEARAHRDEVLTRIQTLADHAAEQGLNLLIENAFGSYAAQPDYHLDAVTAIKKPNVKAAFDFSAYVYAGADTMVAWEKMRDHVIDIHLNDAKPGGPMVLPGQGSGKLREVLGSALNGKWVGLLTIKPQLAQSPGFEEKHGGEQFNEAAQAAKALLEEIGHPVK